MSKNPVMAFPIKKRINTELFIERKQGFYIQKWFKKLSGKIEEGRIEMARKIRGGMRTQSGSLFGMTYLSEGRTN